MEVFGPDLAQLPGSPQGPSQGGQGLVNGGRLVTCLDERRPDGLGVLESQRGPVDFPGRGPLKR